MLFRSHAVTDCGAGGFSSAVGEMGESIGAEVWLERVPLKYEGLSYTEIWISEAQERMVLAVPEEHWDELAALCASENVEATVIGEHGSTQVPLFSSVRIDGRSVPFSEEEKRVIREEIPNILRRYEELQAGRTAGWTSAVGLAKLTRAVLGDSEEVFPCSVVLDGEYGARGLSMGVPVRLGRSRVKSIEEWPLAPDEQEGLERTLTVLANAARVVDENLG